MVVIIELDLHPEEGMPKLLKSVSNASQGELEDVIFAVAQICSFFESPRGGCAVIPSLANATSDRFLVRKAE